MNHAATTPSVTSVSTVVQASHPPSHRPTAAVPHPTFAPRPTSHYDVPKLTTKKSSKLGLVKLLCFITVFFNFDEVLNGVL